MESYIRPMFRQAIIATLKSHDIPHHVSFILDGNRTYAKKVGVTLRDAYDKGVDNIIEQIRACSELNVPIISLYLFSEKNFQRKCDDVESVFQASVRLFGKITKQPYGGCYKMIGDLPKLPDYLLSAGSEMENSTRENKKFLVFVLLAYSGERPAEAETFILLVDLNGREELTQVTMKIHKQIKNPKEVTLESAEKLLYVPHCDSISTLIIRTSCQKRLSDYLPWQNAFSTIYFLEKLWPEFNDWDMFKAIFHFQSHNKCKKTAKFEQITQLNFINQMILQQKSIKRNSV